MGNTLRRRACAKPGCPVVHRNRGGFCDAHKPPDQDDRANSTERGYNWDWRRERERFLRDHPWCMCDECQGAKIRRRSEVVDHIKPHHGDPVLFWDRENWQALCVRCHNKKTGRGE